MSNQPAKIAQTNTHFTAEIFVGKLRYKLFFSIADLSVGGSLSKMMTEATRDIRSNLPPDDLPLLRVALKDAKTRLRSAIEPYFARMGIGGDA